MNIHFSELTTISLPEHGSLFVVALLLLIIASIKSAQYPFSYWLPRAMEGPTTSSAIFYGALSVHMGLFILLRTAPLWSVQPYMTSIVALCGLITAVVASSIARVQASVKTQIAYSSITQIGIMFVEVAFGFHWLALVHFVCHASLRTYQLLISPSTVSYLIHHMFYHFTLPPQRVDGSWKGKVYATLYILALREWNMDILFYYYIAKPMKSIGRLMNFLDAPRWVVSSFLFVLICAAVTPFGGMWYQYMLSFCIGIASILILIRSFSTKSKAMYAWNQIGLAYMCAFLSILLLIHESIFTPLLITIIPLVVSFCVGHYCLFYLDSRGEETTLRDFSGHSYEYPRLGALFFLTCLVFMSFPLSSAFLGQEIILSVVHTEYIPHILLFAVSYILLGVSILRVCAKIFFGPHKKTYHEVAYRSA